MTTEEFKSKLQTEKELCEDCGCFDCKTEVLPIINLGLEGIELAKQEIAKEIFDAIEDIINMKDDKQAVKRYNDLKRKYRVE